MTLPLSTASWAAAMSRKGKVEEIERGDLIGEDALGIAQERVALGLV